MTLPLLPKSLKLIAATSALSTASFLSADLVDSYSDREVQLCQKLFSIANNCSIDPSTLASNDTLIDECNQIFALENFYTQLTQTLSCLEHHNAQSRIQSHLQSSPSADASIAYPYALAQTSLEYSNLLNKIVSNLPPVLFLDENIKSLFDILFADLFKRSDLINAESDSDKKTVLLTELHTLLYDTITLLDAHFQGYDILAIFNEALKNLQQDAPSTPETPQTDNADDDSSPSVENYPSVADAIETALNPIDFTPSTTEESLSITPETTTTTEPANPTEELPLPPSTEPTAPTTEEPSVIEEPLPQDPSPLAQSINSTVDSIIENTIQDLNA